MASRYSGERVIPGFTTSSGKELWQLGLPENRPELESRLAASGLDGVRIADAFSEELVGTVRRRFDASRNRDNGRGAVHSLSFCDDVGTLRRLLSFGLDPDPEDEKGFRPSHWCSYRASVRCAEALVLCRPDLEARNGQGRTPEEVARDCYEEIESLPRKTDADWKRMKMLRTIREIWGDAAKNGFPPLAKIASDQTWWAVKNLCRRRVVGPAEAGLKYDGKTAAEWAEFHGRQELADEIRHLSEVNSRRESVCEEGHGTSASKDYPCEKDAFSKDETISAPEKTTSDKRPPATGKERGQSETEKETDSDASDKCSEDSNTSLPMISVARVFKDIEKIVSDTRISDSSKHELLQELGQLVAKYEYRQDDDVKQQPSDDNEGNNRTTIEHPLP